MMPAGVRLRCPACDVAWNDDDRCWMCGQTGEPSWSQPSTGPNYYAAPCWPFQSDLDEDDVIYWSF